VIGFVDHIIGQM